MRPTGEGRANAPAAFRANSRIGHTNNTIYTYTVVLSSVSALRSTVAITGDPIDSGEPVVSAAAIPGAVAVAVPEPYTIALAGGPNGTESS